MVKVWDNSQLQLPRSRASLASLRGLWLRRGSCHSRGHLALSSESRGVGILKTEGEGSNFPPLEFSQTHHIPGNIQGKAGWDLF